MKKLPSNRTFGIFLAIAFSCIGVRAPFPYMGLVLLGLPTLFVALAAPHRLHTLNLAWYRLGLALGRWVSPIVLTAFYYLIFSPLALLLRIFGHKPFRPPGWIEKHKPCRFEKPF
jgi:hypothetical protein